MNDTTFYLATDGKWVDGSHDERREFRWLGFGLWYSQSDASVWKARPTRLKFFGFDDGGVGFDQAPFAPDNYVGEPYAARKVLDGGWLWHNVVLSTYRWNKLIELLIEVVGYLFRRLCGKKFRDCKGGKAELPHR